MRIIADTKVIVSRMLCVLGAGDLLTQAANPLVRRIGHGAAWSLVGTLLARLVSLLAWILVARKLGSVGFGELGIIQSTVGMVSAFAGFGLGLSSSNYVARYRTTDPARVGRIIALSTATAGGTGALGALVLCAFAAPIAAHALNAAHLETAVRLSSMILLFNVLSGAQSGILAGFEAFKINALLSLCFGLLNTVCATAGAYLCGVNGSVSGQAIALGAGCCANHLMVHRFAGKTGITWRFRDAWQERGILYEFNLPVLINSVFASPVEWLLNASLAGQANGYSQLGIFNAARQWQAYVLYIPMAIASATFPVLANLLGERRHRDYSRTFWFAMVASAAISVTLSLPIIIFGSYIMRAYGSEFARTQSVLYVVLLHAVLYGISIFIGQVLWTSGKVGVLMACGIGRAVVMLPVFWLLSRHQALGLAYSYLAFQVAQLAFLVPYLYRKLGRGPAAG